MTQSVISSQSNRSRSTYPDNFFFLHILRKSEKGAKKFVNLTRTQICPLTHNVMECDLNNFIMANNFHMSGLNFFSAIKTFPFYPEMTSLIIGAFCKKEEVKLHFVGCSLKGHTLP